MKKFKFIEGKIIDMYHFKMFEGKFQDMEEQTKKGSEVYIYANISNFETDAFEKSEVTVYAHPYEQLYYAERYKLYLDKEDQERLKRILVKEYHNLKTK